MPADSVKHPMTIVHTPGPWSLLAYEVSGDPSVDRKLCVGRDVPNEPVADICEINEDLINNEAQANARLISAAPDLLAACKQLVGFIGLCPTMPISATSLTQILEQFNAAIEKAEPAPVRESARPCGCDPGEKYTCEQHRAAVTR